MINAALLSQILMCPLALAQRWTAPLNEAMQRFEINTPRRIAHFLAQIGHESLSLQHLQENLSYSRKRIGEVFGRRLSEAEQPQYVRKPERLANRVYANRNGNRDEASGDGYRYRGRGPIALTGRDNYRRIGELLDLPLEDQPELLESPEVGALAAAAWWQDAGLNALADRDDLLGVSRRINLGSSTSKATPEGMADRTMRTSRALLVLGVG
jgi:putative chitinase